MNIGDNVIFTKKDYIYPEYFTYGKSYIITKINKIQNKTLLLLNNDKNDLMWISDKYFNNKQDLRILKLNKLINDDETKIKNILINIYETKLENAIKYEKYEIASKYKKILNNLSN